jgi:predicted transposase YdaD
MEISVDKPYDSLFKKVFRDIDNTRDFLKSYLPKDLAMRVDFEPMTISGTEKDDAEYNSSYLDLTVECKLDREDSKIYIIFEHKSYQESMTIVLCYESGDS